jgi:hypothetical protein
MSAQVGIEQAQRLREAETRWLRQSAERLRAAHRPQAPQSDKPTKEAR